MYNTYDTKQIEYLLDEYGQLIGIYRYENETLAEYHQRVLALNKKRPNPKYENLNNFLGNMLSKELVLYGDLEDTVHYVINDEYLYIYDEDDILLNSYLLNEHTISEIRGYCTSYNVSVNYFKESLEDKSARYLMPFDNKKATVTNLGDSKIYLLNPFITKLILSTNKTLNEVDDLDLLSASTYYLDKTRGVLILHSKLEGKIAYEYLEKEITFSYCLARLIESKNKNDSNLESLSINYPTQETIQIINDRKPLDIWR